MAKYIFRRLLQSIPTVIILTVIIFSIIRLIPGDPTMVMVGEDATEEQKEVVKRQFGLDKPILVQYGYWIVNFVQGDFGVSIVHGLPVSELLAERVPNTIYLAVGIIIFVILTAIPLGVIAAIKRKTWADVGITSISLLGLSIPDFVFGVTAILCFSMYWRIFPSMGFVGPSEDFWGFLKYMFLPVLTHGSAVMAVITRLTRSTMLDQLSSDYVRTHKAQGIKRNVIYFRLALKNALIPVVTILGMRFGHMLGGTVVIEIVFSWPGVGRLILESINNRDFPVVQAACLIMALMFVVLNLLIDISYKALDPRVKIG